MVLAIQLKSLIKKRGLTVVSLSKATGVPAKTLYSWLQNQSPRNLGHLRKVAIHFKVSLEFLLFNEERSTQKEIKEFQEEILAGNFEVILRKINN